MNGNRIKKLRKEAGLTQAELGKKLGVVKQTVSSWENNISEPNGDTLIQLSQLLNTSPDFILGGTMSSANGTPQRKSYGQSLAYWISKTGLGYDELARKVGLKDETLDDYCSGALPMPLNVLAGLSEICGVSTDCLLGLSDCSRSRDSSGELPFQFDPEISRRLKEQANIMDESYDLIASILGIEESEVYNFFEYGFVPHITVFVKIVEHFLVSSDYLLNRSNSTLIVQKDEEELLRSYRALNPKSRTMALSRIYELEREESLVAAKEHYLDSEGKSLPSSGTGGNAKVG